MAATGIAPPRQRPRPLPALHRQDLDVRVWTVLLGDGDEATVGAQRERRPEVTRWRDGRGCSVPCSVPDLDGRRIDRLRLAAQDGEPAAVAAECGLAIGRPAACTAEPSASVGMSHSLTVRSSPMEAIRPAVAVEIDAPDAPDVTAEGPDDLARDRTPRP